jgi:cell division protein FtsB
MSPDVRHRRAVARLVLAVLLFVALLFVFAFPIRTLLAQRRETGRLRDRLELLREESDQLEREAERLGSDAEVERIARERYNLIRPGETPYVIVPETTTTTVSKPSDR